MTRDQAESHDPRGRFSLAGPLALLLMIAGLGVRQWSRLGTEPAPGPIAIQIPASESIVVDMPKFVNVDPPAMVEVSAPVAIESDPVAIAAADAGVADAEAARTSAIDRAEAAEAGLTRARDDLDAIGASPGTLGPDTDQLDSQARDAVDRGEVARAEIRRLVGELAALASEPKPRGKPLVDKTPVARAPDGEEFHFELRGNRIAPIDLEKLLDRVRVDARIQLRLSDNVGAIRGLVGPVGAFSLRYELRPEGLDLSGVGAGLGVNYGLGGWELVPTSEVRGETLSQAVQPASDFLRALSLPEPSRDALTFWVYPDSFALFRRLRDMLTPRGYLVAGRPLPADMAIRGSPSGSLSAGQ